MWFNPRAYAGQTAQAQLQVLALACCFCFVFFGIHEAVSCALGGVTALLGALFVAWRESPYAATLPAKGWLRRWYRTHLLRWGLSMLWMAVLFCVWPMDMLAFVAGLASTSFVSVVLLYLTDGLVISGSERSAA